MKTSRRDFLRTAAAAGAGAGAVTSGLLAGCTPKGEPSAMPYIEEAASAAHSQLFNMSGYRAPALDRVRIGLVGIGDRGIGSVERLCYIEGTEIVALCDIRQRAIDGAQEILASFGMEKAAEYTGSDEAWKAMCERDDIDLVYICTPWIWHTPISVYAMENGSHAACEVPIARTVDEAWQLVETSERTKKHCMQLENCCYDFFELLTLNMARQGMFGDILHAEGAYIHNLMGYNFKKPIDERLGDGAYTGMWRLKENAARNGNLYPTHGLGPVCQAMNINRGDKMDYLTSMSTNDFSMSNRARELAAEDPFYDEWKDSKFRGNMNTTLVRTALGKTIMIQHDVSSIRPYSRIHLISGTKGIARKYPANMIALGHSWLKDDEMKALWEQYTPEIVNRVGEKAREVGGHGGMDFIMDWRLIDCLRNGLPLDQDVYDGAAWSVISPLTEWSVANRSASIDVPDFTGGSWKTNKPVDIQLLEGGSTGVRQKVEAGAEVQLNV